MHPTESKIPSTKKFAFEYSAIALFFILWFAIPSSDELTSSLRTYD
jgi:hypothetical protein